jgi:hypothetical protein
MALAAGALTTGALAGGILTAGAFTEPTALAAGAFAGLAGLTAFAESIAGMQVRMRQQNLRMMVWARPGYSLFRGTPSERLSANT